MSDVRSWFDDAVGIPDRIQRAQALCDLAFDAEAMAASERRAEAIELFELLATLDRSDDLLQAAIESADEHLVALGVQKPNCLEMIVQELHAKFQHLAEHQRLVAVAKTVVREHARRPEAWLAARGLLDDAHQIQPLAAKELRFRAEVVARIESGA